MPADDLAGDRRSQHLAPGALDVLENLANATASAPVRLQICVVGQPKLRILLNAAKRGAFREVIGVDRHLALLDRLLSHEFARS